MLDTQRQSLNRMVLRSLTDPDFRTRLTARHRDGSHSILIFGVEDPARSMLDAVTEVGGSANVVVPYLNGLRVVHVETGPDAPAIAAKVTPITDCTVGVLVQRIEVEADEAGWATFVWADSQSSARAELVAVAA